MAKFDVLIRGGRVIDPANGILDEVKDVALKDGLIAAVAEPGEIAGAAEVYAGRRDRLGGPGRDARRRPLR